MKIRYTTGPGGLAVAAPRTLTLNEMQLVHLEWSPCTPEDKRRAEPFTDDFGLEFKEDEPVADPLATTTEGA